VTETGGDEGGDETVEEAGKLIGLYKKCSILPGDLKWGFTYTSSYPVSTYN
jgi:hypothetical protein